MCFLETQCITMIFHSWYLLGLSLIFIYTKASSEYFVVTQIKKKKKNILREKPNSLYFYMTHLFRIYNMFLLKTKHNNECSKMYSCTEINKAFFVKIKHYTLAWHSDCIIIIYELAFYSKRRWKKGLIRYTNGIFNKTDTQKKRQMDKQLSTNTAQKTKDRATRTPLKTDGELRCSESLCNSCSTSDTRHIY